MEEIEELKQSLAKIVEEYEENLKGLKDDNGNLINIEILKTDRGICEEKIANYEERKQDIIENKENFQKNNLPEFIAEHPEIIVDFETKELEITKQIDIEKNKKTELNKKIAELVGKKLGIKNCNEDISNLRKKVFEELNIKSKKQELENEKNKRIEELKKQKEEEKKYFGQRIGGEIRLTKEERAICDRIEEKYKGKISEVEKKYNDNISKVKQEHNELVNLYNDIKAKMQQMQQMQQIVKEDPTETKTGPETKTVDGPQAETKTVDGPQAETKTVDGPQAETKTTDTTETKTGPETQTETKTTDTTETKTGPEDQKKSTEPSVTYVNLDKMAETVINRMLNNPERAQEIYNKNMHNFINNLDLLHGLDEALDEALKIPMYLTLSAKDKTIYYIYNGKQDNATLDYSKDSYDEMSRIIKDVLETKPNMPEKQKQAIMKNTKLDPNIVIFLADKHQTAQLFNYITEGHLLKETDQLEYNFTGTNTPLFGFIAIGQPETLKMWQAAKKAEKLGATLEKDSPWEEIKRFFSPKKQKALGNGNDKSKPEEIEQSEKISQAKSSKIKSFVPVYSPEVQKAYKKLCNLPVEERQSAFEEMLFNGELNGKVGPEDMKYLQVAIDGEPRRNTFKEKRKEVFKTIKGAITKTGEFIGKGLNKAKNKAKENKQNNDIVHDFDEFIE